MGALQVIFFLQFRIFLPLTLLTASIVRYNAVSFIYLAFLLITPLLKSPVKNSLTVMTKVFLQSLMLFTMLPLLGQIIFNVIGMTVPDMKGYYGKIFINCSQSEKLIRQLAYQRLNNTNIWNILRLLVPDIIVFAGVTFTMTLSNGLKNLQVDTSVVSSETPLLGGEKKKYENSIMNIFLEYLQNAMLLLAGTVVPSLLGAVYFTIFLICLTLWGCYKTVSSVTLRVFLLIYTGTHILLLHLYQFQFFQECLPPSHALARIVGLTGVVQTSCRAVSYLIIHPGVSWSVCINPGLLLLLYWILAINTNRGKHWEENQQELIIRTRKDPVTEANHPFLHGNADEQLLTHEESPAVPSSGVILELDTHSVKELADAATSLEVIYNRRPCRSIIFLLMRQSYVLSLTAMMAWSITYHSWMTFVFLLTACLLWILPYSNSFCLYVYPVIVTYAQLLLVGQYIICMNFDSKVLSSNKNKLEEIGFKRFENPFPNLCLQMLYCCLVGLTLRQYKYEDKLGITVMKRKTMNRSFINMLMEYQTRDNKIVVYLGNYIWLMLCKYWIFFCTIMMMVISLQDVVIYRIIYMILFLVFIIIFNLNFTLWRAINYAFWWVVVVYSMFVLALIYTYQFKDFNFYWKNITGFDEALLKDIGLEKYDTAGLFIKLLSPTCFLVFVILQLRYFHTSFLELSSMDRYKMGSGDSNESRNHEVKNLGNENENRSKHTTPEQHLNQAVDGSTFLPRGSMKSWLMKKALIISQMWCLFILFLWRLGEIHIFKLVTFTVIVVAVKEVSALTAVYVLLIVIMLPLTHAGHILSLLLLLWTTVIILLKIMFQLSLTHIDIWKTSCVRGNLTTDILADAKWIGLAKIKLKNISIAFYVRFYILILIVIVFESIIHYHQKQLYNHPLNHRPLRGILFPRIRRSDADKDILSCLKFFANFAFYKFGLECCYIMTAVVVCVRVDVLALIYILLVAALITMPRRVVAQLWPCYKLVLAICLAVQFLFVLGFPYGACITYPWSDSIRFPTNLRQWLYLPAYSDPPKSYKLIVDFLQLLLVSLQAFVFSVEASRDKVIRYGGGDNSDILAAVERNLPIPYEDFTLEQKSGIDTVKLLLFENMYWVTMAVIFITGATRINIFSFFYVMAVFIFMWYGKEFYAKPLRSLLQMWNYLIWYCLLVLFLKTAFQLFGCVYVYALVNIHQCWLLQLFGVNCLLSGVSVAVSSSKCVVEADNAGLAWDVVCLTFLLLQRRVYSSHYFRHIADTIQAQGNLVAKGAEIINRILIRQVHRQNENEREILMHIKKQMRELKTKQAMLKKDYQEPEEHFQAIRSGDYYLLDYDELNPSKRSAHTTTDSMIGSIAAETSPRKVVSTSIDVSKKTYEFFSKNTSATKVEYQELEPDSVSKMRMILNLITSLWYSFIDGLIHFCNQFSHNYRLVAKKLSKELITEKRKIILLKQVRHSTNPLFLQDLKQSLTEGNTLNETPVKSKSHSPLSLNDLELQDAEEIRQQFEENTQRFSRLIVSGGLVLATHSELLCYFLMILNQIMYGSLLSLPLPLMVFLWGMLSVPRPSRTFWITVITYTEAVVVCKYFYQFAFFPWNEDTFRDSPFFPPRIIGIEKTTNYANVDIALLLALFLHRSILRKYGLWRDAADITADMEAAGIKEHPFSKSPSLSQDDDFFKDTMLSSSSQSIKTETRLWHGLGYIVNPFATFFRQVTHSTYNATTDVYAPMFFCDFILFLVLVFGFNSFGPAETTGDENVAKYLQDSKIPVPFLVMLITQFIFILIDRAIFLRKFVLGKFVFQLVLVILVHIWMFFVLPAITKRNFFNNGAAQIWYLIKCVYFGLSAHQIRCGYPNRILGNFLTKKYSFANLILYKGFLAIPFLLELRALMDWIWTDSTLAIGSWLQMEDIYANIFVIKCWREFEKKYPQERAVKKSPLVKYLSGGALLVIIIFIIWFPLVFFSFFNTVFISNPPYEVSFSVGIGGYQPLFSATAQGDNIRSLSDAEFSSLRSRYVKDRNAYSFLSGYEASDVTLVEIDGKSLSIWGISPIGKVALTEELQHFSGGKLALSVRMKFVRDPDKSQQPELKYKIDLDLGNPTSDNKDVAATLAKIVNGTYNDSVEIFQVFPRFLRLAASTQAVVLDRLISGTYGIGFSNISLRLQFLSVGQVSESWSLSENIQGSSIFTYDPNGKRFSVDKAYVITFNDRKTPESLSFISQIGIFKGGVVVMYVSFVLVVFKFVRVSFVSGRILYIYLEEAPDVDYLLQTIDEMHLAREMKDYWLEEEIFAKLLFILRCPDVLFNVTRIRNIIPVSRLLPTSPRPKRFSPLYASAVSEKRPGNQTSRSATSV